jgi:hypothetical protein
MMCALRADQHIDRSDEGKPQGRCALFIASAGITVPSIADRGFPVCDYGSKRIKWNFGGRESFLDRALDRATKSENARFSA